MGGTEKQKNIVIYTAIYNNYDDLKDPKVISSSCDYVCFTDNPKLRSNVWEIKYYPKKNLDPTRKNRKVKILPHLFLNYEYSVYIDGNIDIIGNIEELIEKYLIKKVVKWPPLIICHAIVYTRKRKDV